jgi:uncharacterized membrane protein YfhO
VETDHPALLLLSEIYYPAWKASIDGKPAKVQCANYALRAISVPPGKHTIICKYSDHSFKRGLLISIITLIAAAGAFIWISLKNKNEATTVSA